MESFSGLCDGGNPDETDGRGYLTIIFGMHQKQKTCPWAGFLF
jgi:hypothetical protein